MSTLLLCLLAAFIVGGPVSTGNAQTSTQESGLSQLTTPVPGAWRLSDEAAEAAISAADRSRGCIVKAAEGDKPGLRLCSPWGRVSSRAWAAKQTSRSFGLGDVTEEERTHLLVRANPGGGSQGTGSVTALVLSGLKKGAPARPAFEETSVYQTGQGGAAPRLSRSAHFAMTDVMRLLAATPKRELIVSITSRGVVEYRVTAAELALDE
jgi:hypothetical protein